MTDPRLERALALHRDGDPAGAERLYRELLGEGSQARLLRQLALAVQQQGRAEEALALYRRALEQAPADPELMLLAGFALRDLGRFVEARPLAARADLLMRGDPAAKLLLGSVLAGLGEYAAAEAALRAVLARQPDLAEAHHHLAVALHRQRRWSEAMGHYQRALADRDGDPDLLYNLGLCEEALGRREQALDRFRRAHAAAPGRADLLGRLAQAQALVCDWEGLEASTSRLEELLAAADDRDTAVVEPFVLLFLGLSPAARREALRRHAGRLARQVAGWPRPARAASSGDGRIRVGYLSPDFGMHAVGGLVRGLFTRHDRGRFEVHGFDVGGHRDEVQAEIAAGVDRWHALAGQGPAAVAAAIAAAGIDILVDLGGFTLGAMPQVLALRPAPLQFGWLGFLHDHGPGLLDYLVLDEAMAPPGEDGEFSAALVRLPGSALPASPPAAIAARPRAAFGLPDDRVLLASFNNSYKLDCALFRAWSDILAGAPGADLVLWLPTEARPRFLDAWAGTGLASARLHLVDALPPRAHRERMAACDLFLDAFAYQAGATAVDAALAGLPLLACPGDRPSARMAAGLNRCLGLDELVVADRAGYVERAVELATDPERLAGLRRRLRAAAADAGLADPGRTVEPLEAAFEAAWRRHLAGEAPAALKPPGSRGPGQEMLGTR